MIYFIVTVFVLVGVYLLYKKYSTFTATYEFHIPKAKMGSMKIEVGNDVYVWLRPNSDQIFFYNPDSKGRGLIGVVQSRKLYKLCSKPNNYLETTITYSHINDVAVRVKLKQFNERPFEDKELPLKNEVDPEKIRLWVDKVTKAYNPRTTWEIKFYTAEIFTKEDINIKCVDKSNLDQFYRNEKDTIWLERKNGDKIEASNQTTQPNIYKTLRALNHNEIKIVNFKEDRWSGNAWYYIEIGI